MAFITPYLNFNGTCLEAFEFYKSVFGTEFSHVARFKDMPSDGSYQVPEETKEMIMHIALPIGKDTELMGSDVHESFGQKANFDGNVEIMVTAETLSEAKDIWARLSANAKITMPLELAFWGDYLGALTDQFGVKWMVNCPAATESGESYE